MKFTTQPQAQTLQQRMGFVDHDLTTPGHDAIMLFLDEHTTGQQLATWLQINGWDKVPHRSMDAHLDKVVEPYRDALESAQQYYAQCRELIEEYQAAIDGTKPITRWNHVKGIREVVSLETIQTWLTEKLPSLLAAEKSLPERATALQECQAKIVTPEVPEWPGLKVTKKQWEMPVMSGTYPLGFIDFVAHYQQPTLTVDYRSKDKLPYWKVGWTDKYAYFEVKTTIPSLGELLRQLGQYLEAMQPHERYGHHVQPSLDSGPFFVVSPDDRFAAKIREQGYGFIQAPQV